MYDHKLKELILPNASVAEDLAELPAKEFCLKFWSKISSITLLHNHLSGEFIIPNWKEHSEVTLKFVHGLDCAELPAYLDAMQALIDSMRNKHLSSEDGGDDNGCDS